MPTDSCLCTNNTQPTIYIAGTIGSLTTTTEILDRFTMLQSQLEALGFAVRNPVRGRKIGDIYEYNEIVGRDEYDIDHSDILIAVFPYDTISIGTPMEIYRAREIKKIPIIIVSPIEKIREHHWIKSKATKIFCNMDDATKYLADWYN